MPDPEKHYSWQWDLTSSPEALWPLVSDTDRFNRDCGFPPVVAVPPAEIKGEAVPGARRLRAHHLGLVIEWDERPFEWIIHHSFGVERLFHRGPFSRILARCDLVPRNPSGTRLTYQIWFTPANPLGHIALGVGGAHWQFRRPFDRVFHRYDQLAQTGEQKPTPEYQRRLTPGGRRRLEAIRDALLRGAGQPVNLVDSLSRFVANADDLETQRIRAYKLADRWQTDRRQTLQACLHATRAGLLDFRWDVICPHCRGAKATAATLGQLRAEAHCDTCLIDFTAEFDRSVELTFTPNPAVRRVPRVEYCIGGPQITPHIAIQQTLQPDETAEFPLDLPAGRYRLRSPAMERPWMFAITPGTESSASLRLENRQEPGREIVLAPGARLAVHNPAATAQRAVIEHLAWSDQATMASEVTALQLFRDLFARELLRPDTQLSVGSMTVVFTDLKGSTQLYRDIGDALAFSRVLTHFDLLKSAVDKEGGAIVKTMGDAVMAIFPRPAPALRAMFDTQRKLALSQSTTPWTRPPIGQALPEPLTLKVGLHHGPCIVINQNERLDYFGTTVNVAARLCALSTGHDLLLSEAVRHDPEVETLLSDPVARYRSSPEQARLRGMADEVFEVHRLQRTPPPGT
jgi:class 3 adenylate cyclase